MISKTKINQFIKFSYLLTPFLLVCTYSEAAKFQPLRVNTNDASHHSSEADDYSNKSTAHKPRLLNNYITDDTTHHDSQMQTIPEHSNNKTTPVKANPVNRAITENPLNNENEHVADEKQAAPPPAYLSYLTGTVLFVHSQDGLNIREQPSLKAKTIARMVYNDQAIVASTPQPQNTVTYDNIDNIWIKVKYQNITGYAFGGYLSRYPVAPMPSFKHYLNLIKKNKSKLSPDINVKRYKTRIKNSQAIILENASFNDGFLIARRLFNIPERLHFPIKTKLRVTIVNDPAVRAKLSNISLEFQKNQYGEYIEMKFFERGNGWGRQSTLTVVDGRNIKLQKFHF